MVKWTDEEEACLFVKVAQNGNLTGAAPSQNVLAAERAANQDTTTRMPTNPCGKVADWSVVRTAMPGPHRKPSAYHSKWSKLVPEIYEQTPDMVFPEGTPDGHKLLVRAAALGRMVGPINITAEHNAPPPPPAGSFPAVPPSTVAATLAVAPAAPAPSGQVASAANMDMDFGGFSLPSAAPAIAAPAVAPTFNPHEFQAYLDRSQEQLRHLTAADRSGPYEALRQVLANIEYWDWLEMEAAPQTEATRQMEATSGEIPDMVDAGYLDHVEVGQNGAENQVVPDEDEEADDGEGRRKRQRIHISI